MAAVVVILGACAATEPTVDSVKEAEPTTAPPSPISSSTTSVTTTPPLTTTAPVSAEPLSLAEYLAAGGDIAALALVDVVRADPDPFQMLEAYDGWAQSFATLIPPVGYEDYHKQWMTFLEGQRDAFTNLLLSADPQAALGEFMETMTELTSSFAATAQREGELITEILRDREGDPTAAYFVAKGGITSEEGLSVTFEELFAALGGLMSDPEGSARSMASLLDATGPLMDQWENLEPPPHLVDLHNRQMETWNTTVEVFASLIDALESDEPMPRSATLLLQELSDEAPLLNAEWSLASAAALRGENSSGVEGRWHRDSYGTAHEQLFCSGSRERVECRFLSHSSTDSTVVGAGEYVGSLVDADDCLPYMHGICSAATAIAQGTSSYSSPPDWQPLRVPVTLAVLPGGRMALSWDEHPTIADGEFHCPWFRSYETALASRHTCTPEPWKAGS